MGKRLASIIAVLAMLAPMAGYALGLGNIAMKSALNQPLDAEIELLSVQKGDVDDLRIRLGSVEDFARVGAERAHFLTKIKFKIKQRPDGSSFVSLHTTELVTEPFLDFVVEARWPRGRILREFTVLVDPPVLINEAPAPIQRASTQSASVRAVVTRQPPIQERATLAPVVSRDGSLTYGPVRTNDTLWVIANRMRPDSSVSVNQMMAALVHDNPQAFYNGNANQLKAGYVLRIEDPASLSALSVAQADMEIERQRAEWEARKSGRPLRQVASAGSVDDAGSSSALGSRAVNQARLKLVAPGTEGSGSGTGDGDVDRLRQDLVLAAEALDANRQETDELKTRLAQMEEQLAAMQRLIMLKDDEMLSMQTQMSGEVADETTEPAIEQEIVTVEVAEPEAAMPAEEVTEEIVAESEAAKAPAPIVETPMPEPSLLDDPMLMYGGLGVLVLALVGWFVARRRKMQDGFQESILNVGDGAAADTDMPQTAGGESSMVSDFAMSEISDMSGIQTDSAEVDPISEADVYLAYGRHQQAEDIIRAAIDAAPERNELKLKMLEVFFAAKNSAGFAAQAQELRDVVTDDADPMWEKAVTMGCQLCPENPLFGDAAVQAVTEALDSSPAADDENILDFDFDLDSTDLGNSGDTPTVEDSAFEMDAELDAALSGESDLLAKVDEATQAPAADNGLDFDVSSLDFNLNQADAEETDAAVKSENKNNDSDDALDFDMGLLDETESSTSETLAAETESSTAENALADEELEITDGLDFDMDGLSADSDAGAENIAPADITADDLELSADLSAEKPALEETMEIDPSETAGSAEIDIDEKDEFSIDLEADGLDLGDDNTIEFDIESDTASDSLADDRQDMPADELIIETESDLALDAEDLSPESNLESELTEGSKDVAAGEDVALGDDLEDDLLGDDIFNEVDEIGTKLDLAKAYVDMGDGDGARSILDEVLEDGDDAQKEQAEALLKQLS